MDAVRSGIDESFVTASARQAAGEPSGAIARISPEERHRMIAEAAYRRFEQRDGTAGDPVNDWLEAEKEVDATLAHQPANSAFLNMLSSALAECRVQLDDLHERAKMAGASLKREYEEQLVTLGPKYETARQKFVELREQTDDAWGHLREGAEKAFSEMRTAIRQAASEFK